MTRMFPTRTNLPHLTALVGLLGVAACAHQAHQAHPPGAREKSLPLGPPLGPPLGSTHSIETTQGTKTAQTPGSPHEPPRPPFQVVRLDDSSPPDDAPRVEALVGWQDYCALLADGRAFCFAWQSSSSLGAHAWQVPLPELAEIQQNESAFLARTKAGALYEFYLGGGGWVREIGSTGQPKVAESPNAPRWLVPPLGLEGPIVAFGGRERTCAATRERGVCAWAAEDESELVEVQPRPPERVRFDYPGIVQFALGLSESCARTDQGLMACAQGRNPPTVVEATGVLSLVGVDGGVCWLKAGAVQCHEQFDSVVSTQARNFFAPLGPIASIRASHDTLCAVSQRGEEHCLNRSYEPSHATEATSPLLLPGLHESDVAREGLLTCTLHDGAIYCWGSDPWPLWSGRQKPEPQANLAYFGKLRFGDLNALSHAKFVGIGNNHQCIIGADEKIRCWGDNLEGELGRSDRAWRFGPTLAEGAPFEGTGWKAVALAGESTCALSKRHQVVCVGDWDAARASSLRETKGPDARLTPPRIFGRTGGVAEIVAGAEHYCLRTENGEVRCLGRNDTGQLGNGTTEPSDEWSTVLGPDKKPLGNIVQVRASRNQTCALSGTGKAYCFGESEPGASGRTCDDLLTWTSFTMRK